MSANLQMDMAVRPAFSEVGSSLKDWLALLKPRVISLVVFTGAAGMAVAPRWPSVVTGAIDMLCICIGAGAAGAINMWYDRDIDAIMKRTSVRPIPDDRMNADSALIYGVVLSALSVAVLWLASNGLAAAILAFSIFFYAVIYTMWLKRRTPQNIVIGGAAGAFPPMIGWAAAMNDMAVLPVVMFAIVFLWTPPHFWSLSLYACKDYTRAGIPMLPVVRGQRHTRWQILIYTFILSAVTLVPSVLKLCGPIYTVTASLLDFGFIYFAFRVLTDRQDAAGVSETGDRPARLAFRYSLAYLFFLFLGLLADRLLLP
ncbi:protoheme IX farnesyltransferase [Neoasaia chiangmaiensis NBRC 101099]|uniref:Protoheme IX farnesyltransferase n=1 Tax=Neoasaia chiangmaiensis TaxID=320497 RepID=A0A1U9KN44_9PROT|nr:heme o synthase [Neoasaia chiangmaiensis]AQS87224.1 protoheme IX farnesyltransferase [Neoasaia chiangmaiensis]GBR38383.1 protoheme IX farnesyltransferase [Neoasaia chiangmaiensis NBRC 101099]GEN15921.1 protoheme IX farnesyltransferase [Neoasaia chiangmaiensis]